MKTEDKDLILRDICGRLPYGVKAEKYTIRMDGEVVPLKEAEVVTAKDILSQEDCPGYMIRPYLFPLSSMTEEQKREYHELVGGFFGASVLISVEDLTDFFNKNHIDYRGLISIDLAIDATNKNIY
jgi:hypothetical protein